MDKTISFAILILIAASGLSSTIAAADGAGQEQENRWEATSEKKFTIKLDATPPTQYCKSATSIEYYQDDKTAKIDGEIKIDGCTNANGKYTISVRFRDGDGETHNLDFEETWQRNSAAPVLISHVYPMAENVDLIRVRARRSRCVCTDSETPNEDQEITMPIEPRKDQ